MADPKRNLLANIISSVLTGLFVLIVVIFIIYEPKQVMSFVGLPGLVADKKVENDMPDFIQPVIANELNSVAEHVVAKSEPTSEDYDFKKFAFRDKLEEKRLEEERKIAEIKRKAEEARKKAEAEKKRLAELEAKKKAEAAEKKRLEEIALKKKQEEEKKKKEEEARQKKLAEEKKEKQKQEEIQKQKEADKKAAEEAEKKRIADKKAAEEKLKAEEAKKAAAAKAKAEADAKAKAAAAAKADGLRALEDAGYQARLADAFKSQWNIGMDAIGYTAVVAIRVDKTGKILEIIEAKSRWSKNDAFDANVRATIWRVGKVPLPNSQNGVNQLANEILELSFDPKDMGLSYY